jgi:hypothetical protein
VREVAMHRIWSWCGAVALALTVSACGDRSGESVDVAPSAGSAPTQASVPSSTENAPDAWELLYISDSSGWNVGEPYARHAEEALGRPVRLVSWRVPNMSLLQARQMIADNPDKVAAAEIVVLWGSSLDSGAREDGLFACYGMSESAAEFQPYTPEDWAPYTDLLQSVVGDIRTLREGQETVIRVVDLYVPVLSKWRPLGIDDQCTAFMESQSAAIRSAAAAAGVTMVSVYDALNGPEHDQDPVAAGHIRTDGEHLTESGGEVAAAALAAAGFEPTPAP